MDDLSRQFSTLDAGARSTPGRFLASLHARRAPSRR